MRSLFIVALSMSMSFLVALAIVHGPSRPQPDLDRSLSPTVPEADASLALRVSELERRLEVLGAVTPADALVSPRTEPSRQMDLEKRLAQLEVAMAELLPQAASEKSSEDALGSVVEPHVLKGSATITPLDPLAGRHDLNKVLLDSFASEADKVAAQKSLRRVEDAYEAGAVQELLLMAQVSTDPDVRADVWTHFDGTTHVPEIVPALVLAIRGETNEAVRIEAVETLGNYLDDPQNRTLIEGLAKNDPVQGVRDRALRTLKEHPAVK